MALIHDIGWEHAEPVGGSRRTTKCKYYGKVIHGSITRLKQHIAHISGQVEECPRVSVDIVLDNICLILQKKKHS